MKKIELYDFTALRCPLVQSKKLGLGKLFSIGAQHQRTATATTVVAVGVRRWCAQTLKSYIHILYGGFRSHGGTQMAEQYKGPTSVLAHGHLRSIIVKTKKPLFLPI